MGVLSNIASAIAEFFGWRRAREERENAAPMQARAAGATDQEIKDGAAQDIAQGNLEKIRKDLAE